MALNNITQKDLTAPTLSLPSLWVERLQSGDFSIESRDYAGVVIIPKEESEIVAAYIIASSAKARGDSDAARTIRQVACLAGI